ncbi:hypothetical protein ACG04R_27815 [Roseateles sp. BYS78W]|uniref:Uncharacterized protein n=1 Tax=Pelomonas candidula TaxID=3299025 RepID=A0ABW7HLE3_9BURK
MTPLPLERLDTMKFQKTRLALIAALFALAGSAMSQPAPSVTNGVPVNVFADPSDVVIELDQAGRCGSKYFHIQRMKPNFKEVTAVMLTAFATGKRFVAFVEGCAGDRNIISHGFVTR